MVWIMKEKIINYIIIFVEMNNTGVDFFFPYRKQYFPQICFKIKQWLLLIYLQHAFIGWLLENMCWLMLLSVCLKIEVQIWCLGNENDQCFYMSVWLEKCRYCVCINETDRQIVAVIFIINSNFSFFLVNEISRLKFCLKSSFNLAV